MKGKTVGLCALATTSAFLFLSEQLQATRLSYALSRTRAELHRQRSATAYLRLELARLQTPERLAQEARARLGMLPATPECIVVLGSTVPRLAAGAPSAQAAAPAPEEGPDPGPRRLAALFGPSAR